MPDTPSSESNQTPADTQASRNFPVACVVITCTFVVHSMLLVAVPVYALALGASPFVLGVIFSAPYLLPLLLAIPVGQLVTRYGGRALMATGGAMMLAGLLAMLVWPGYGGLLLGQLLIGLAQLLMVLAGQAVVSGLGSGKRLEHYFGWYATWISAGQVAGPLLAGALIQWRDDTTAALWLMVMLMAIGTLGVRGLTGQASHGVRVNHRETGFRAQLSLLGGHRGVQLSILITLAAMLAMGIHGSYLPVYLEDIGTLASVIGILVSLRSLAAMLVRPFMARIVSALGNRHRAILVALVLVAAGLGLIGTSEQVVVIALCSLLVGVGSGISQPLSLVVLAESVETHQRAGALGMRLMANRVVNFLGPLAFGAAVQWGGFALAFAVTGVLVAMLAGVIMLRAERGGESR